MRQCLPLLFVVFLGYTLHHSQGNFAVAALLQLILAWGWMSVESWRPRPAAISASSSLHERCGALAVFLFSVLMALKPQLVYFFGTRPISYQSHVLYAWLCGLLDAGAFFAAMLVWVVFLRKSPRLGGSMAGAAAACWLLAQVVVVIGSPHPLIDVFTSNTDAADYLIRGLNPYAQKYVDIYNGKYDYPPGFVYWPGVLYPETLARWCLGDIRWALVAADLGICACLLSIARTLQVRPLLRMLLPLLWLSFPLKPHLLEMAWVDPLLIFFGLLTVDAVLKRRLAWAGLALGVFCGVKQYSVFFGVLTFAAVWASQGARAAFKLVARSAVSFAALLVPFIAWDAHSFFYNTVQVLLTQGMRDDSLSIPAAVYHYRKIVMSGGVMAASYATALILSLVLVFRRRGSLRSLAGALVISYGAVFLMGKQSFGNYYYFFTSFAFLSLITQWSDVAEEEGPSSMRLKEIPAAGLAPLVPGRLATQRLAVPSAVEPDPDLPDLRNVQSQWRAQPGKSVGV
jgi:hypothetical protein